ncbi:general odorant-binding protein 56h-like isoform X2 [Zootermopsis nevadensis]|nr:general odorant-binding protein 56h-like isoform X2 [Zootermopsis nevadensis]
MAVRNCILILGIICSLISNSKGITEQDTVAFKKCKEENGMTAADEVSAKSSLLNDTITDTQKCYWVCLLTAFGEINADGSLNEENAVKEFKDLIAHHKIQYSDEELKSDVADCAKIRGDSTCDKAFAPWKCLMDIGKRLYRKIM